MRLDPTSGTLSPFEAARAMSIAEASPGEPGYWSGQMQAVARRRDQICFMRIYDHFAPRVRLYLRGLGVREAVAEELAQEALLRLWQRADSYDADRSTLSTWLFRIARNLHIDRLRRENQWIAVDLEPALEIETETDNPAFSSAESFVAHADLNERIERLSTTQARLIRMSYFEAKSHQQIADELGMPLGTVKSSIRRAFLRLQSGVQEAV
ncbi:MAG TPA: sigma-70 family RNA polymerase sigma factor [Thermomonas sp.]|jgi:RNA polymerase sigma-70 factor (ECF subfamily)|nr:sigma-70 family RNA polymerase sigma factor [Thermomonas sp.]